MEREEVREVLAKVAAGTISPEAALRRLAMVPYEDLGYAKVDHHRSLRQGEAEVVYCPGKLPEEVAGIMASLAKGPANLLATRADASVFAADVRVENNRLPCYNANLKGVEDGSQECRQR